MPATEEEQQMESVDLDRVPARGRLASFGLGLLAACLLVWAPVAGAAPSARIASEGPAANALNSVACPSVSQCTAVNSGGGEVTFNPGAPGSASPVTMDTESLNSVACPSAGQCTAVDSNGREVTFNPASPAAGAPAAIDFGGSHLSSIVCVSTAQCTAIDSLGREVTFNPLSPGSPTPEHVDPFLPLSLACTSANQCLAVNLNGAVVTFNPYAPGDASYDVFYPGTFHFLYGVACPSEGQCTTVDYNGEELTFPPSSPGRPPASAVDGVVPMRAVSCPSVSQCTAVDIAGREVTFNPASPQSTSLGVVDPGNQLISVACPSESQCTAVDGLGHEVTFDPDSPVGSVTSATVSPPVAGVSGTHGLSVSHASLSGVRNGRPRLSFTVTGAEESRSRTITIHLPGGLSFSGAKKALLKGIAARVKGKSVKFTASAGHSRLAIRLNAPAYTVALTISSPMIAATKALQKSVKSKKTKTLSVLVAATNTSGTTGSLTLKLHAS